MSKPQISVLIPLLNEEESLPELHDWIHKTLTKAGLSYEILFIDDGSKDDSWKVICELKEKNERVRGLKFSRNYGKTAALDTGFQIVEGDVIITMDADLQDNPEEIPELYRKITEDGYDIVSGWKKKRHDPVLSKNLPSKLFNWAARKISDVKLHDFNCGLKAYDQKVVKNIRIYGEMHRYIPVIAKWNGFDKIGEQVVQHQARKYGHTKFGIDRFINGFLDLLSITFVNKFGRRPMHFFGAFGVISFIIGTAITVFLIGEKLYNLWNKLPFRNVTDNPLFFLALLTVMIGVQLFLAGFLGELYVKQNASDISYVIDEEI
ncbi:glycosyltransferase family 2 protein [Jiulongibacter sediminis]|uniref:Glycosyl transferase family 2 n=1 Tax=Jiulongibacter sediminis TaxID=1605367 RepID=A0A0P7BIV4_9BACT|nr:glycosyltransferase family 2 protein [Jiulongibacter sediminis]KPM47072.1 glycosyl transferase family 2 [Jiulongibacter sediminis]TBX22415.1 glycosyl transferase family 2 [Jiulongibacter sediminis]